jgi:xanthine dehydrogenase accessory factor
VYDIALGVAGCLRAGTRVDVAWVVEAHGFGGRSPAEALAITPGGGRMGTVLSGALNDQLAELVAAGISRRLVELHVGELEALAAGLTCGGDARCLMMPAAELPSDLWDRLRDREPVCLVAELAADQVVGISMFTAESISDAPEDAAHLFGRGRSDTAVSETTITTVLWPIPTLVMVGAGAVVDALDAMAGLLGWQTQVTSDESIATGLIAGLAPLDKVVVVSHDDDLAGAALTAALASEVGYIGALGSRRTQRARADWLAYRDITDLTRIHGPAGLNIGAAAPAEIAVSILAEALAVASADAAGRDATASIAASTPGPG